MESSTVNALQTELEFYRQNQVEVEEEIRMLIADNQQLSQKVAILLKEKLENERQTQNNDEQGKETDDLRRQVAMLIKERDSLHILWQTSQKTIDALETELKAYQCYDNRSPQVKNDLNGIELETMIFLIHKNVFISLYRPISVKKKGN
ncbi:hypothetical protein O3G_MSEX011569 [Manduca sexta]|uniref:Uncharacterized protein n=1 Tax=Manduca sexta TaxID=7130 RepID=A0A921ZLI5_MANSE|nr:hypothetical protein O3G_MSEX011569 [Manduca sexta]